jgi:hypothetical protein
MDRYRFSSPTLPVPFPAPGRGGMPLSNAPAGLSFRELRNRHGWIAALWSAGFGLTAAWLGQDRFNTITFALVFCLAALTQFEFARAAYARLSVFPTEFHR